MFPVSRPRRLRSTPALRELVAETRLHVSDLVAPLFVREGISSPQEIKSLPGVVQHTVPSLVKEVKELASLGLKGIILFGVPSSKDEIGSGAFDPDGIAQVALREVRAAVGDDIVIMSDLCVDEYTSHGHCGVLDDNGCVVNDATLEVYCKAAIAQATAGAHLVAPSGMMDGQVGAIRAVLDEVGFTDTAIMAYTAKYATALYGPFREAVNSSLQGDRRTYQQDPANGREALRELALDVEQGADVVMVKPSYLDVVAAVAAVSDVPVAVYQVSGEYSMIEAAAAQGWIDRDAMILESLTGCVRAGADIVLTYYAVQAARLLNGS